MCKLFVKIIILFILITLIGACGSAATSVSPTATTVPPLATVIPPTVPPTAVSPTALPSTTVPPTVAPPPAATDSQTTNAEAVAQLEEVAAFDMPDSFVNTIAFSPDSRTMITGDRNGEVLTWDRETWQKTTFLPAQSTRAADSAAEIWFWGTLALSPDGQTIVTAYGDDGAVTGYDRAGQELFTFSYGARVYSVAISPDGKLLAVGGLRSNIVIFDLETRQPTADLPSDHEEILTLVFSPDGEMLLAVYQEPEHIFAIWDTATWQETDTFSLTMELPLEYLDYHDVLFSLDGKELVIASTENVEIRFLDFATKQVIKEFPEHRRAPYQIAFSPDGDLLASASNDGTLRLWNVETGVNFKTIRTNQEAGAVAFSPDGTLIAVSVWGKGVQVWAISPPATSSLLAPTPVPQAAVDASPIKPDIAADLQGLDIDTFFEASYKKLLLRDPEVITQVGLNNAWGISNDQLTNISDEYIRETQRLEAAILSLLRTYDRATLTAEQQVSYDVYEWYLDDRTQGYPFMYDDYPASFLITTGINEQLVQFFTDIHPVTNKQDAEDYVARLSQVDTKLDQLVDGLQRREKAGVVMPQFLIPWVLYGASDIAESDARSTPFYTAFKAKVVAVTELSAEEKEALLQAAEKEIDDSVVPGFQALAQALEHQQGIAAGDEGVWKFSDGAEYYAYTLRHHTTLDLTADEIHELGLRELERIHAEMRAIFDELGYPQDDDLVQLIGHVVKDSGTYSGDDVAATYETLIAVASEKVGVAFDLRPKADVIVKAGPAGDYYNPPTIDGSRPGVFYAKVTGSKERFAMPTLAYHEAVPGHHFQIAIAQELPLPSLRRGMQFTAYAEGWALYAERLTYELGFYEGDPYGNIGRLQAEAFRAARLVVDTGIHANRWGYHQAVDFMVENTGLPREMVETEVARYIVWPGQATAYEIGMLKILEVRQKAMNALGDRFDLKEFHNVVLGNGSMPLEVLERVVDDWIEAKQG